MKCETVLAACLAALLFGHSPVSAAEPSKREAVKRWQSLRFGVYLHHDLKQALRGGGKSLNVAAACANWTRTAKEAGAQFVVLVVKHEDGFCLWDSDGYGNDVGEIPGKPDVLKAFIAACRKEGLLPGVHYSVGDAWNETGGMYKDRPVSAAYVEFTVKKHVRELHTRYPQIAFHLFDLAHRLSPSQRRELYDLVHGLNPTCIVQAGPYAKLTEGSWIHLGPDAGLDAKTYVPRLAIASVLGKDWGWSPGARCSSAESLYGMYAAARRRQAALLMNAGLDASGLIPTDQAAALEKVGNRIRGTPEPGPERGLDAWPAVLVDRSHEWLFAYDDLADRMLCPAGFRTLLCDASLDAKARLSKFDVVMVQQTGTSFEYTAAEVGLLKKYVQAGGSLLIVGNPRRPIANVARAFGFELRAQAVRLPLRPAPWLVESYGADEKIVAGGTACALRHPEQAKPVIVDSRGTPVAAVLSVGQGRVLCFADDGPYWDFCSRRDKNGKVTDVATTVALFRCLSKRPPSQKPAPPAGRMPAEGELTLPGLLVRFSRPVAVKGKALLAAIPRIAASVAKRNGTRAPGDRITVNVLATAGGGYSGGATIGVQCDGDMANNVAVIAHEMTHSWTGHLPGILGEGWASMVGMRITAELGYTAAAKRERKLWQDTFENAKKAGKKLEFAKAEIDRSLFGPCEGKMMALVEHLESKYGADFMPRFLRITRALKPKQCPSIREVLYYFSLTAGEDLSELYRKAGITYDPPPPIPDEQLQRRLPKE